MARPYARRKKNMARGDQTSHWLPFSDLMSAMMLVFILVVFYSVYQYFDMLELKTAELLRQSGLLDQKEAELVASQAELTASLGKLTESEEAIAQQQYQLLLTTQAQEEAEKTLSEQRAQLDTAQVALTDQQTKLDDALSLLQLKEDDLETARALMATQQLALQDSQIKLQSQQALLTDQQAQLEDMVGVRARIVQSLADALSQASVKAKVDAVSGSIALDASVLFDVGQAELKPGGAAVLDQFLPVYLGVLEGDGYQSNISEIIIEGHTDSTGTYLDNLKLSQERALAVMTYILSPQNTHLSASAKAWLRRIGTCNGRSFSNLITHETGAEDAESSRRVEFKFRMHDEQMLDSMRRILDSMEDVVVPSAPVIGG